LCASIDVEAGAMLPISEKKLNYMLLSDWMYYLPNVIYWYSCLEL
jgi:hypothetical protein